MTLVRQWSMDFRLIKILIHLVIFSLLQLNSICVVGACICEWILTKYD